MINDLKGFIYINIVILHMFFFKIVATGYLFRSNENFPSRVFEGILKVEFKLTKNVFKEFEYIIAQFI